MAGQGHAAPFAIEPFVPLSRQVDLFAYAHAALAVLICACAIAVLRAPIRVEAPPQRSEPTTWKQRLRWFVFAAIPAAYLTAVTQFLTTDLTPAPLLWVVPLLFYLASFVLVFFAAASTTARDDVPLAVAPGRDHG